MPKIKYQNIIKRIKEVSEIDTEVIYVTVTSQEDCPECELDPLTGLPINSFCPLCNGVGYIAEDDTLSFYAGVEYVSGLEHAWESGGKLQKGDVVVTVVTDELESIGIDPVGLLETYGAGKRKEDILNISYFTINNVKYDIANVTPGKLQGIMYELVLELSPREKQ